VSTWVGAAGFSCAAGTGRNSAGSLAKGFWVPESRSDRLEGDSTTRRLFLSISSSKGFKGERADRSIRLRLTRSIACGRGRRPPIGMGQGGKPWHGYVANARTIALNGPVGVPNGIRR
jgi:hypothetical protein